MVINRRQQKGFSLIEVLVSVIVLSVGLLGMAALQTNTLRFTHDAQLRSIAAIQANNMADRLRANQVGVNANNYNNISGIPTDPNCSTCTAAQIALRDTFEWNTDNSNSLPAGAGTVVANGNIFNITVRWDNARTGVTGLGCSGNPQVDLSCITLSINL